MEVRVENRVLYLEDSYRIPGVRRATANQNLADKRSSPYDQSGLDTLLPLPNAPMFELLNTAQHSTLTGD